MTRIETCQPSDFAALVAFLEAIQEHERELVPGLKPGPEILKTICRNAGARRRRV
jgi:hypothetical protein